MSLILPSEAHPFLDQWLGAGHWSATALRGDASIRGYYRVTDAAGQTYMLAYYPEQLRGGVQHFMRAYEVLSPFAPVPPLLRHCDVAVGQFDVGDETILDALHRDRDRGLGLYEAAVDLLAGVQLAAPAARELNPAFDAHKFMEELAMTSEYYVHGLMKAEAGVSSALQPIFQKLSEKLTLHPYVLCHRDYHGENIHIFSNQIYIIDYQDMRMGPDTYDLASLLRDRGVASIIGEKEEARLVHRYRTLAGTAEDLHLRYRETLLQRSLKILGTFARQALTRGRDHYLDFIPSTLESVRFCLAALPEYEALTTLFPLQYSRTDKGI